MRFYKANRVKPSLWLAGLLLMAASTLAQTTTLTIHLYSPWAADPTRNAPPAFIEMVGSGAPIPFRDNIMTAEGADWFKVSITYSGTQEQNKHHGWTFVNYIPTTNFRWSAESRLTSDGTVGGPQFNLGEVFFNKNWTEVWIIPQGPGKPPIIQDYPPPKKVVFFYNPWPAAAPTYRFGAGTTYGPMRLPDGAGASRCGWYVHYFQDEQFTVHFKHIRTAEAFGQAGIGSPLAINLAEAFKTSDTVFVYQEFNGSGPAKVSNLFPSDRLGTCGYKLAMTVRDFSREHPDFERGAHGGKPAPHFGDNGVIKNMVMPVLDTTDRKPDQGPRKFFQEDFENWFRTNSTAADPKMRNYETCQDLDIQKDKEGYWTYSSLVQNPAKGFFPITDVVNPISAERYTAGFNDGYDPTKFAFNPAEVPKQNFHFCMEMHADFKYEPGQVFSFIGDDDVWVFINNKLAIDLGGPHSPQKASVGLDTLKLTAGQKYNFDLFYCERSTSGSNLFIQTSIYFEQTRNIFAEKTVLPDGSVKWVIKARVTTGGGYCGATGSSETIVPAPSKFTLSGPGLAIGVDLPVGTSFSGITVDAGKTDVSVDTAKIKGLQPGLFTITYTSLSTGQSNILQFIVPKPIFPQYLKPVATPPGYTSNTLEPAATVTLRAETGAVILYSTDGNAPDTLVTARTRAYVAGTTVLQFSNTTVLKAIAVGPGHLPSEVMTETYTRIGPPVSEIPTATPPGRRFIEPLAVSLETRTAGATILYSTDGNDPDSMVTARTRAFVAGTPITLTQTTVLKAMAVKAGTAKSGIMTETYTFAPPVTAVSAAIRDKDGDGRVETITVDFSGPITLVPSRMSLKVVTADGQAHDLAVTSANNGIILAADPSNRVVVNLSTPLPFGATSVSAAGSAGQVFRQEEIPLLDGTFPILDSAGPVITKAEVFPVDSLNPLKRVVITFSEPMTNPAAPGSMLVFKRESEELASGRVGIARADAAPNQVTLYIDSLSEVFPIVGDSVALLADGTTKDAAGNAPVRKLFRRLEGEVPKATPPMIYVTFADGSRTAGPGSRAGSEATSDAKVMFIPVDRAAQPLTGPVVDGKCTGCFTGAEGNFVGPVVHLEIPGAASYEFRIFNNLGEFVALGTGTIRDADLKSLTPIQGGTKYMARVVWTGRTVQGRKAGTGAYVLSAQVKTEKDLKTGAPASVGTRKIRFGMLRAQSGS